MWGIGNIVSKTIWLSYLWWIASYMYNAYEKFYQYTLEQPHTPYTNGVLEVGYLVHLNLLIGT